MLGTLFDRFIDPDPARVYSREDRPSAFRHGIGNGYTGNDAVCFRRDDGPGDDFCFRQDDVVCLRRDYGTDCRQDDCPVDCVRYGWDDTRNLNRRFGNDDSHNDHG